MSDTINGRIDNASNTLTFKVPSGYFVLFQLTTQAAFKMSFILADSAGRIYFDEDRQSTRPLPVMTQYFQTEEAELYLTVIIPESVRILTKQQMTEVKDEKGELIVRSYTVVGEDSFDDDYNDLMVSLTAWRTDG